MPTSITLQTYTRTYENTLEEIPLLSHSGHASQRLRLHLVDHSTLSDAHHSQSHLFSVLSNMSSVFGIIDKFGAVARREMYLHNCLRVIERAECQSNKINKFSVALLTALWACATKRRCALLLPFLIF